MRMTVEELKKELEDKDPKALVQFQTGVGNNGPSLANGVQRVDNFGHTVVIVVEQGA